ncbi:MAG: exonuclease subunit SbcD [Clostridia bacterium]|jgi:DNA repair protein SbcD/Mre11|nr:exonuclease subunit SbcD [Clostridia bacterium]
MKILHTSDWHIGHALYGKKRNDEHSAFLNWLTEQIASRDIDALVVSGDIFDTGSPGGAAEQLYFDFLTSIIKTNCKTVVIVAGNHDSPRRLQAPAALLKKLHIHVIGIPSAPADHVIELKDSDDNIGALCCAVPYLRKNDMVRIEDDNISTDEKIILATKQFYSDVAAAAKQKNPDVPIIATGHLFAQGATTSEGDGVRELYVGSLGHVGADVFPEEIDYVALGHIHSKQTVSGNERIRYSGSPLCMSFSEIGKPKYVLEIDTLDGISVDKIEVPAFRQMKAISGDYDEIISALGALSGDVWVEVTYTGSELRSSLSFDINEAVRGSDISVLSIRNKAIIDSIIGATQISQTLESMKVADVFLRCMDDNEISGSRREHMTADFNEIVREVQERDLCE